MVVFARIDPDGFHTFFSRWVQDVSESFKGKTVAIDGKTLRRSHDRTIGKSPVHIISAWSSDIRMVLGQLTTDDKSNEITAIPELIKTLALEGAIDAMGCQKKSPAPSSTKKPITSSRSKTTRNTSMKI